MKTQKTKNRSVLRLLLSVPLRFKITVPYLVIASLLAGLATYQVGRSFLSTLEAQFQSQLADASARVIEGVVDIEEQHLKMARTIAFTTGIPESIKQKDEPKLRIIISPIVYNNYIWFVDVLDSEGLPIFTIHRKIGGIEYIEGQTTNYKEWQIVRKVISGEQDEEGDKYIDFVDTQWGRVLYTSSPVKTEDKVTGVVLIGTPLTDVVSTLSSQSIADVTLYTPSGEGVASTLDNLLIPPLSMDLFTKINQTDALITREFDLHQRDYFEALSPLLLRGNLTGWFIGVTFPKVLINEPGNTMIYKLVGIFVIGFLALIGLGIVIAQVISKPIFKLVDASQKVEEGNLNVRLPVVADDEIGYLTRRFNRMVSALRQREFIREMFGRMVSEDVREAILQNKINLVGETKDVAVLFTDVRDFTSISENVSPGDVISILNEFFSIVTQVTADYKGVVNHFGGDSVLAVFGAPINRPLKESLQQAIYAACEIQKGALILNAKRVESDLIPLRYGIGINSGKVVAGNVGSEDRFEYTVIGDVVNIAARLQGISGQFPQSPLLISASAANLIRDQIPVDFDYLGEFRLKGKESPIPSFAILGFNKGIPKDFDLYMDYDYPGSSALQACYLHCLGYSNNVIAQVLFVEREVVDEWILKAASHVDVVGKILLESYGLSPKDVKRLNNEINEV